MTIVVSFVAVFVEKYFLQRFLSVLDLLFYPVYKRTYLLWGHSSSYLDFRFSVQLY